MNKVLAVMIAGLFAAGAYAQPKTPEAAPLTDTKPQIRAETKKEAKPAGLVKAPGGDTAKVAEGSGGTTPITDKAQARRDSRDKRRAAKDGGKRPVPVQGGTPQ